MGNAGRVWLRQARFRRVGRVRSGKAGLVEAGMVMQGILRFALARLVAAGPALTGKAGSGKALHSGAGIAGYVVALQRSAGTGSARQARRVMAIRGCVARGMARHGRNGGARHGF